MYNHLSLPASLVCLMICMDPIPTHASSFSLLTFGTKKSAQVSVQRQPVYANATVLLCTSLRYCLAVFSDKNSQTLQKHLKSRRRAETGVQTCAPTWSGAPREARFSLPRNSEGCVHRLELLRPRLKLVRPVSAEGSRMGVCSPWAQAVEKTLLPNAAAAGPGSKILKKITFLRIHTCTAKRAS